MFGRSATQVPRQRGRVDFLGQLRHFGVQRSAVRGAVRCVGGLDSQFAHTLQVVADLGEVAFGRLRPIRVRDDLHDWFELGEAHTEKLAELDQWLRGSDQRNFDAVLIRHGYLVFEARYELATFPYADAPGLADSLEAACRANFQTEEPTPEAIEKVVDRVIDEKLNDDQLSESPLTLAELTAIRSAFLDSLVGHYHQRIAYPNFPGT